VTVRPFRRRTEARVRAYHERRFEPEGDAFVYRLVVEYDPRSGIAGVFDRVLLKRGIRRAFERTVHALEQHLVAAG
jgi:hypothetical protein